MPSTSRSSGPMTRRGVMAPGENFELHEVVKRTHVLNDLAHWLRLLGPPLAGFTNSSCGSRSR